MSDALLSPAVGASMWAATGAIVAWSSSRMGRDVDGSRVPLMGVLAAFVFAGQMVNFTIPGTGSSGHLGGGMILAALLGPPAAFLAMASILTVQALFFADGGLLALGCNIFNLGFFPAFIAYPLVFRPLAGRRPTPGRLTAASLAAALVALQIGALGVILETVASGISDLPPAAFAGLMLPIHLAIGVVEGLVTAAVVSFVWKARPELLSAGAEGRSLPGRPAGRVVAALAASALVVGGALSWFASTRPDGLEWSVGKVAGKEELERPGETVHSILRGIQEKTALLPDYGFPRKEAPATGGMQDAAGGWPAPSAGTSVSGVVGGLLTLVLAGGIALLLRRRQGRRVQGGGV